ncbi:hypothetical protein [Halodesulfovibrio marinisediminis]|uniref:Uncharacterized protein n=1 Tax=Halodesulfovibrio marinisediminis DSM 17456 TaxID=1121457 RepID=A0A1N6ITC1_9BACT|nr:hypothetical protein [Halodesulfovibrio marinisediminis]SIO35281.1 hypothetical protein SAMN02745161_2915 [Halodesulfovibrio marinisediminis DSM 17456]
MQAAASISEDNSPSSTPNTGKLLCTTEQARTLNHVLTEKDIVIGAYFTQKVHPQHGVTVQQASFDYIADWFHSAIRLGLNMVIMHDGLPEKFMDKCRLVFSLNTPPHHTGSLHFVPYSPGRFTIADERFFAARDLLEALPDCRTAFIVDISDAWFNKNPANLILRRNILDYFDSSRLVDALGNFSQLRNLLTEQRNTWQNRYSYTLFIGGEVNSIGQNPWMIKQFETIYERQFPEFAAKPIRNCGIIGGRKAVVLSLLSTACAEMERLNITDELNDMAVFNYILHRNDAYNVYSNGTLNSPWKTWRKRGCHAIFHK